MTPGQIVEIVVIIAIVLFLGGLLSYFIYKKVKGEKISTCDCSSNKGKKLVKAYNKKYKSTKSEEECCCCQNKKEENISK